ncbi:hypothetical protein IQ225_18265 [Synechocystis salina LEGE 06155]|nr:hypothetical protein [Synechocystis salina LEGE 06155]
MEEEIDTRNKLNERTVPRYLCINNLESKLSRLKYILSILNIEKYNLVFIGTIGQGKTTAICHLFNLVGDFKVSKNIAGKSRTVVETKELLATGSGRTTICEVIIKSSPQIYIEITPYTVEEMEDLITNFCDSLVPDDNLKEEQKVLIPREIETAIRYIVGLRRVTRPIDGKEVTIDEAKELLEKTDIDNLKKTALENANLSQRLTTRIDYAPQSLESSELMGEVEHKKDWIRKTFRLINSGLMPDFAIPKKISIFVDSWVLDNAKLNKFESIIDTKGIDENPLRRDLQEYIERDDTICLFATGFKDAPETNIRELMRFYLASKSREFHHRFSTLVIPHKGEPEKVNDSEGNREKGISMRRDDIESIFRNLNLEFIPENIIFYDALQFYKPSINRIESDFYTLEDVHKDSERCINEILSIIDRREKILLAEVPKIEHSFQSILSGKTLTKEETEAIEEAVHKIESLRNLGSKIPSFVYEDSANGFVQYYNAQYKAWNTKHAIHRNYGLYGPRNIDIFYDARIFVEGRSENDMLRKFTKEAKGELEQALNSLVEANNILEEFLPELIREFYAFYDNFIDQVGEDIEQFLLATKFAPLDCSSEFWMALIEQKGKPREKGETYTGNVCQIIELQLESPPSFSQYLKKQAESHWKELVNNVLKFFGK